MVHIYLLLLLPMSFSLTSLMFCVPLKYIYIYIYTCAAHVVVVQYSCLLKRPFFAKKNKLKFAKLSRTLCFSFAGVHHLLKPLNLVGTRFLNTSARSVFGSAGGCYRQEAGVGADFFSLAHVFLHVYPWCSATTQAEDAYSFFVRCSTIMKKQAFL